MTDETKLILEAIEDVLEKCADSFHSTEGAERMIHAEIHDAFEALHTFLKEKLGPELLRHTEEPGFRQHVVPAIICRCGHSVGFVHPETHEFVRSEDVKGQSITISA